MTRKLNTALIIILLVALTCVGLASGQDQEKDHEFKVLIGSGLLNAVKLLVYCERKTAAL